MEHVKVFLKENGLLIAGLGVFLILFYFIIEGLVSYINMNIHMDSDKTSAINQHVKKEKNMSVLLIGTDNPENNHVRTDALIFATYNHKKNKITTVRLPRDIYVEYLDYKGKINGVYDMYGMDGLKNVVEEYTGVPITNYAQVDFKGLEDIVDSINGIDLESNVTINETNNAEVGRDIFINQGHVHLNGKEALAYARIRHTDNDIERGKREQQVLKAIMNKVMSPSEIPYLTKNVNTISTYIMTDVNVNEVIPKAISKPKMERIDFDWTSFDYNGSNFVYLTPVERERISETLRQSIGLDKEPLSDMVLYPKY